MHTVTLTLDLLLCSEIFENGLGSVWQLEEEFRKKISESGDAGTVSQELKEKLRKVSLGNKKPREL